MEGLFEGVVGGGLAVLLVNSKFKENSPIWLRVAYITIVWFLLFSMIELFFKESSITTFWDTFFGIILWIYLPLAFFMYFFKWIEKLREELKD